VPILRVTALAVALVLVLLAAPLAARAQQPNKIPRVGWLSADTGGTVTRLNEAFRDRLRELGYVEGRNIVLEYRSARAVDRLASAAAELVRLNVDLIFAPEGMPAALAAKNATSTIPVVMALVADPVAAGLVDNLARPGGNVTGPSAGAGLELFGKRLELLKEALPKVSRVAVLWDPNNPGSVVNKRATEAPAGSLGLALHFAPARTTSELEPAFSAMRRGRAEALIVLNSPFVSSQLKRIVALAATNRLPAIYMENRWAEGGGLMSYGPSYLEIYRRAATYVDRILKGAKPADLPVEQPTKFELAINLKTARALGLTIPPALVLRADQVIE
jgi:putative ABC transport system substrate-binding protein